MNTALLFGNPNVGKSALFNRLTGAYVVVSNYPGTTVEFTSGIMRVSGERVTVEDAPGTYSLEPSTRAEEVAVRMLDSLQKDDALVLVLDSTNLERGLHLALQALKRRLPTIIALNLSDEARHIGIEIDAEKLKQLLGIPCIPTVAITGVGIKDLINAIPEAQVSSINFEDAEIWHRVGDIVREVQVVKHRHHTMLERLGDASVKPLTGIPLAIVVTLLAFYSIRYIGEGLVSVIEPVFDKYWAAVALQMSDWLGSEGIAHDIVIGKLAEEEIGKVREKNGSKIIVVAEEKDNLIAQTEKTIPEATETALQESAGKMIEKQGKLVVRRIDYGTSFGLLTTGLFVVFAAVLPYIIAFFFILSIMEDVGYLPRLAVLVDTVMHRLGLHGMAIVPMLLGLGCNVPGALSARVLESKRERFIAATLMAVAVPCMAQIAMIIGLAGEFGPNALVPIFLTLFLVWVILGLLMSNLVRGESPEILLDVPPYRLPYWKALLKKVWMRIVWFVRGATPWVLFGVLIVNILYTLGIIRFIGNIAAPVVTGLLGLPRDAVGALVIGFLRKDVAVGMLKPLQLSVQQTVVACVVLTIYFPCVATFAVLLKELGWKDMLKSSLIMVTSALTVGTALNLILHLF